MRSKTPGHNAQATHPHDGRRVAGGRSTTDGRANNSLAEAQRIDELARRPLKLLRFTDVRERTGLSLDGVAPRAPRRVSETHQGVREHRRVA